MLSETQTKKSSKAAPFAFFAMIVLMMLFVGLPSRGQQPQIEEIPLERCDCLPVARVQIDGESMRFLLDTGATSALNLRRASKGEFQRIQISSWKGTVKARARMALIRELTIGRRKLRSLTLPAYNIEAIGQACGGRIDGLLGMDLLEPLEATIDLKRFVLRIAEPDLPAGKVEIRIERRAEGRRMNGLR